MTQTFQVPAYVAESMERRRLANAARLTHGCGAGVGRGLTCENRPAVLYPRGWRCSTHSPARVVPDPARTLAGLREAAGLRAESFTVGRTVLDNRAESKGQRVSSARRAAARGTVGGDA